MRGWLHRRFNRWAVVERQPNGTIQIVSTHIGEQIALGYAWTEDNDVMLTHEAVERIESQGEHRYGYPL